MTVKELIKKLKKVYNQNARVDILVPSELFNDNINDYSCEDFEIHNDEFENDYIELYCLKDLEGNRP